METKSLPLHRRCQAAAAVAVLFAVCLGSLEPAQAQTVASDGKNSVLTVPVEGDLDAIFFYDDLTRDLTGFVVNTNGVFNIKYKVNIEQFFTGPSGKVVKEPKFLFAVGKVSIRTKGRLTFGGGAIYITESKTGQMVALALPWSKAYRNQARSLVLAPLKIQKFSLRNVDTDE
jgi:hypothetical protein